MQPSGLTPPSKFPLLLLAVVSTAAFAVGSVGGYAIYEHRQAVEATQQQQQLADQLKKTRSQLDDLSNQVNTLASRPEPQPMVVAPPPEPAPIAKAAPRRSTGDYARRIGVAAKERRAQLLRVRHCEVQRIFPRRADGCASAQSQHQAPVRRSRLAGRRPDGFAEARKPVPAGDVLYARQPASGRTGDQQHYQGPDSWLCELAEVSAFGVGIETSHDDGATDSRFAAGAAADTSTAEVARRL